MLLEEREDPVYGRPEDFLTVPGLLVIRQGEFDGNQLSAFRLRLVRGWLKQTTELLAYRPLAAKNPCDDPPLPQPDPAVAPKRQEFS